MPAMERVHHACDALRDAKLSLAVSAGLLLANLVVPPEDMMVYANDPLRKQASLALQSALPTPEATGNATVDTAIQVTTAGLSLEFARRTTSPRRLGEMAVGAQLLSCAVDAGVERTGWLNPVERAQPDVGFSAISVAWFTNALLHRAEQAKTLRERRLWQTGTAVFIGAMTVGTYAVDSLGGKLDLTSHASGVAVGTIAYLFDRRQKNQHAVGTAN
jgi:hypothetical protein